MSIFAVVNGQFDPNWWDERDVIVHLFEWKWVDIADECEQFLAPRGFAGVQISPPTENVIINNRPWWERYQPVSFILETRSGDSGEFLNMTTRCNAVGIRIYADIVFNHMSGASGIGTGGSFADSRSLHYPAVPFGPADFNPACSINSYLDKYQVRNCRLVGLPDLKQSRPWVRNRIIDMLNNLIDLGVAGFRIDASKHMWPADLETIYNELKNLNTSFGFEPDTRPFIYQEVIDLGGEAISAREYIHLGSVTEFKFSGEIGRAFKGLNQLKWLQNIGEGWNFLPTHRALTFVDNHDNQRGHGAGGYIITYKQSKQYKMATAFHLAWPYGTSRIMSSYDFNDDFQGPPSDVDGNLLSPVVNGSCAGGWICEHRWRQIFNMVRFRRIVRGTGVNYWWDNWNNQIAFGRGDKGFIVFNNDYMELNTTLRTGLPTGLYCDIISGEKQRNKCTGLTIKIDADSRGKFYLADNASDGVIALHVGARL